MPDKKTDVEEIRELRAAIREHTGRAPESHNLEFLRKRLGDLRASARDSSTDDATVVMSVSMHGRAKRATSKLASGEGCGVSELVRRALAEYADRRGYKAEVRDLGGE